MSSRLNYQLQFWSLILSLLILAFPAYAEIQQRQQPQRTQTTAAPANASSAQAATAQPIPAGMLVLNVADIAEGVNTFVVNIQSATEEGGTSYGSGFFIEDSGVIVTNFHVIREAIKSGGAITVVTSEGNNYGASVKGYDESTDLALLDVKLSDRRNKVARLGDSDSVRVGEWVVAVGSPFGLDHTVTLGIISAKGRSGLDGDYDDYLQTDAAINFGNSGGPLVNTRGEVIGINTLVLAKGQGLGFAIPVNILKEVLPQLREAGRVRRSSLAIETVDISVNVAKLLGLPQGVHGVRVAKVERDTPAARAGLRRDDVITAVDSTPIVSTGQFNRLVSRKVPGSKIEIKIFREEREFTVKAELIEKK
ncbi:MAG: trypsin-like peptidase domain-containing protein [Acidobacteriota bacterium]